MSSTFSVFPGRIDVSHGQRQYRPPPPGRGPVRGFSPGARLRLMKRLAEYERHPQFLVTLTHNLLDYDGQEAKRWLHRIAQTVPRHLKRVGLDCHWLWRMEFTASGRVHYHLLLWLSGSLSPRSWRAYCSQSTVFSLWTAKQRRQALRQLHPGSRVRWSVPALVFSEAWVRAVTDEQCDRVALSRRCVDVRTIANDRAATAYISKYVAKVDGAGGHGGRAVDDVSHGRVWGTRGDASHGRRVRGSSIHAGHSQRVPEALSKVWADCGVPFASDKEHDGALSYTVFVPREVGMGLAQEVDSHDSLETVEWSWSGMFAALLHHFRLASKLRVRRVVLPPADSRMRLEPRPLDQSRQVTVRSPPGTD